MIIFTDNHITPLDLLNISLDTSHSKIYFNSQTVSFYYMFHEEEVAKNVFLLIRNKIKEALFQQEESLELYKKDLLNEVKNFNLQENNNKTPPQRKSIKK